MSNKQTQKAGANSQQLQADNITVNLGIDEKRAREIFQEMTPQLRNIYTQEALKILNSRVAEFENSLMPKMEAVEGALEAFADPGFQLLLVEAQKTAASTERPADYELLSELLIHRFQKGEDRVVRTGINRAVEIVRDISDEALLGLTVFHSMTSFMPTSGDIHQGLDNLNSLFGKIIYGNLPMGNSWIDHLEVLNAVRINTLSTLPTFEDIHSKVFNAYIGVGIEKGTDSFYKAIELIPSTGIPENILLVNHELNDKFIRINVSNWNDINSLIFRYPLKTDDCTIHISHPLSEKQKNAIQSIHSLYKQDENVEHENTRKFMEEWYKRSNLKIIKEWWDKIPNSIQLTSVGKVLAHSNAQRCDKSLPPLD